MSLTLLPPLQPPSPPRPPRRSPFSLHFLPLSSAHSTSPVFTPSPSQEWPQLHHNTPDSPLFKHGVCIFHSTDSSTVSNYSPCLESCSPNTSSLLSPLASFPPTCSPSYPPKTCFRHSVRDRRRRHAQRRLSLPARVLRTAAAMSPPSAFRTHERRSSLGSAARKLFHIESDDAVSDDDGDDAPLPPSPRGPILCRG
jgi:hypothetical protein